MNAALTANGSPFTSRAFNIGSENFLNGSHRSSRMRMPPPDHSSYHEHMSKNGGSSKKLMDKLKIYNQIRPYELAKPTTRDLVTKNAPVGQPIIPRGRNK